MSLQISKKANWDKFCSIFCQQSLKDVMISLSFESVSGKINSQKFLLASHLKIKKAYSTAQQFELLCSANSNCSQKVTAKSSNHLTLFRIVSLRMIKNTIFEIARSGFEKLKICVHIFHVCKIMFRCTSCTLLFFEC